MEREGTLIETQSGPNAPWGSTDILEPLSLSAEILGYHDPQLPIGAELMLRLLAAEVVTLHGILTLEPFDLFPGDIDMQVPVAGTDAAITDLNFVLIERWQQGFELDACAMTVAVVLPATTMFGVD